MTGIHRPYSLSSCALKTSLRNRYRLRFLLVSTLLGELLQCFIQLYVCLDCSGPSQVGLKWLKRIYNAEPLPARRGSLPFDDIRLEYKTSQRYQIFKTYVPPAARSRIPIPEGYDNAG